VALRPASAVHPAVLPADPRAARASATDPDPVARRRAWAAAVPLRRASSPPRAVPLARNGTSIRVRRVAPSLHLPLAHSLTPAAQVRLEAVATAMTATRSGLGTERRTRGESMDRRPRCARALTAAAACALRLW
jgi:hypothetical protein